MQEPLLLRKEVGESLKGSKKKSEIINETAVSQID